jgi:aspartate oxidase
MFHTFFIAEKKLPRFLIAGDFLTKMDFHNEKGENFLSENVSYALRNNKHHYIFPEMNREFYAQTLRGEVFGKPFCSASWFEKFKKENEFGFIFKNLKKSDIEKIKFRPAFHFMIGGLVINENAQTNQENVYAAGEITNSIHGANRVGGLAVLESLVFGKRAAISINKRIKKEPESSISGKITERGKLGFSRKMKDKMMDALGPIIKEKELEEFYNLLKKKKNLTSQEKLVKKIAEISLLRKESVGAFYREGLPEAKTAPSSFLVKDSIFFK